MRSAFSASRVINAPAQQIFDVLADPAMHPVIDGSGTVKGSRDANPKRLSKGAKFGMSMRIGAPYRITNTVVEFDEPRTIAWRHAGRHIWRYELEPADGGTKVTETLDYSRALVRPLFMLFSAGARKRYTDAMTATLERLDAQVTGS